MNKTKNAIYGAMAIDRLARQTFSNGDGGRVCLNARTLIKNEKIRSTHTQPNGKRANDR